MMEQVNLCPVSVCNLLFDQSNSQQLCLLHYIISPIDLGLRWLCGAYRYLWWYPAMKLILSGLLLPGLTLGHLVIQSLCLLISGDVELNPGPLDTECEKLLLKVNNTVFDEDDWNTVIDECSSLNSKWEEVSVFLGLRHSLIDSIKRNNPNNTFGCLNEALKQWIMQNYNTERFYKPSWRTLLTAVSKVDKLLFRKLAEQHQLEAKEEIENTMASRTASISITLGEPPSGYEQSSGTLTSESFASATTVSVSATKPHLTFHCLDLKSMSKEEKQQLYQKLYAESENMMYKFQDLFSSTTDSLKQRNIPTRELTRHLECLGQIKPTFEDSGEPVFRHQLPELRNAKSVDDAMTVINNYCSFFNYRMLEHIINKLGTAEDKLKLTKYKEDFAKYGERHIFECPAEVGKLNEGHTNLFVTLDETFDKCNVSHLCVFIHNLQEVLNISDISLQLKHIGPGSVLLTFQIPTCLQIEIFPLSSAQKVDLAALGVVQLSCGDYQFTLLDEMVKIPKFNIEDLTTQSQQNKDIDNAGTEGDALLLPISAKLTSEKPEDASSITDSALGESSVITGASAKETVFSEDLLDKAIDEVDMEGGKDTTVTTGLNELHKASFRGEVEKVKQLTEEFQLNPLQKDTHGWNSLHHATVGGQLDVLKYFVEERGHNPTHPAHKGWTPLHFAAKDNYFEIVQYLIEEQQVDPLCQTTSGDTPLHKACISGNIDLVDYLIDTMSYYLPLKDVACIQNHNQWTPLHVAARNKHLELVQHLIVKHEVDPLCQTTSGDTPLHKACIGGDINVLCYLIDKLSDYLPLIEVASIQNNDGWTPLHIVASHSHLKLVQYLIAKQKVYPLCRTKDGDTPLHTACAGGNTDVVRYLVNEINQYLSLKDIVCCEGKDGQAPIHCAALKGHLEIVKFFIKELNCDPNITILSGKSLSDGVPLDLHDAALSVTKELNRDPKITSGASFSGRVPLHDAALSVTKELNRDPKITSGTSFSGRVPLHDAAQSGHLDIVKFLVEEEKCNPSQLDENARTPLHIAAMCGQLEVVKYLTLEQHCDPRCEDTLNNTPLHAAVYDGHLQVVKFLTEVLHCSLDVKGILNMTPLELAQFEGHHSIVEYLESICSK